MRLAKQIRKNKLIYIFICFLVDIYSVSFSLIEDFFKNRSYSKSFQKKGIFIFSTKNNFYEVLDSNKKCKDNKYQSTMVFSENQIRKILFLIFNKNIREKITKITGFKYSIDHFQYFENTHSSDINYSRSAHFDKSFSRNMLKLFIPLNIDFQSGPLKIWDKSLFSKLKKRGNPKIHKPTLIIGNGDQIYGFNPNCCFHQVGNPEFGSNSRQIMIQMNPSRDWCIKDNIYKYQQYGEQKFTSLSFLFNKTTKFV